MNKQGRVRACDEAEWRGESLLADPINAHAVARSNAVTVQCNESGFACEATRSMNLQPARAISSQPVPVRALIGAHSSYWIAACVRHRAHIGFEQRRRAARAVTLRVFLVAGANGASEMRAGVLIAGRSPASAQTPAATGPAKTAIAIRNAAPAGRLAGNS
jgi:hypothetical protein